MSEMDLSVYHFETNDRGHTLKVFDNAKYFHLSFHSGKWIHTDTVFTYNWECDYDYDHVTATRDATPEEIAKYVEGDENWVKVDARTGEKIASRRPVPKRLTPEKPKSRIYYSACR